MPIIYPSYVAVFSWENGTIRIPISQPVPSRNFLWVRSVDFTDHHPVKTVSFSTLSETLADSRRRPQHITCWGLRKNEKESRICWHLDHDTLESLDVQVSVGSLVLLVVPEKWRLLWLFNAWFFSLSLSIQPWKHREVGTKLELLFDMYCWCVFYPTVTEVVFQELLTEKMLFVCSSTFAGSTGCPSWTGQ